MVENPVKLITFGQEGVGKTTFASLLPNPWFIDIETSTRWIPALKNRQFLPRPKTWVDFINHLNMFKQSLPGDTLVIDSGDWMEALLINDLCARKGWDSIGGNNDRGNSYLILEKEIRKLLDELSEICDMGVNVVITCHMNPRTWTNPGEAGSWDRYELKVQKKTAAALKEWSDATLFIHFQDVVSKIDSKGDRYIAQGGTTRLIECVRTAVWDAKNRFDWPETLPFENKQLPPVIAQFFQDNYGSHPVSQPEPIQQPQVNSQPVQNTIVSQPVNASVEQPTPIVNQQAANPEPQVIQQETPDTSWMKYIDPGLLELMDKDFVKKSDVEMAVDMKGFLGPQHFDMTQYPPEFQKALIKSWPELKNFMIAKGTWMPF